MDALSVLKQLPGAMSAHSEPERTVEEVLAGIMKECKQVPDLRQEWARSGCTLNHTESHAVMSWTMGRMTHPSGPPEGPQVLPEVSRELIKAKVHAVSKQFCEQPECGDGVKALLEREADCFTGAICAVLQKEQLVPLQLCKFSLRTLFVHAVEAELRTTCQMEPGTDTFCPEVDAGLMADHFDCWVQTHYPLRGCSEACAKVWATTKAQFPVCSATSAEHIVRARSMALRLLETVAPRTLGSASGGLVRAAGEVCNDLELQGTASIQV